jgi:hypothetical protein
LVTLGRRMKAFGVHFGGILGFLLSMAESPYLGLGCTWVCGGRQSCALALVPKIKGDDLISSAPPPKTPLPWDPHTIQ